MLAAWPQTFTHTCFQRQQNYFRECYVRKRENYQLCGSVLKFFKYLCFEVLLQEQVAFSNNRRKQNHI